MKTDTQDRKARTAPPQQSTPPPTAAKRRNHPAHEVAMIGLALAQAGINCFLDEHEDLDDCQVCDLGALHHVMEGASRVLDWMTSDLESEALPVGPAVARLQQELQGGIPCGAERLAQAIIKLMAPADQPAADEPAAVVEVADLVEAQDLPEQEAVVVAQDDDDEDEGDEDGEDEDEPVSRPSDRRFLSALWDVRDAWEGLIRKHNHNKPNGCGCPVCAVADAASAQITPLIEKARTTIPDSTQLWAKRWKIRNASKRYPLVWLVLELAEGVVTSFSTREDAIHEAELIRRKGRDIKIAAWDEETWRLCNEKPWMYFDLTYLEIFGCF